MSGQGLSIIIALISIPLFAISQGNYTSGLYPVVGNDNESKMNSPNFKLDANGVPMYKYSGIFKYNPVSISQFGLVEYNKFILNKKQENFLNAKKIADWLIASQNTKTGIWYYDFEFTVPGLDVKLNSGWGSAMAQGQAISLLTRIFSQTKDQKYLKASRLAIKSLDVDVKKGGLVSYLFDHPFYEEYPSIPASYVLNGFMFTLIGLYDLSEAGDSKAKSLYLKGMETLVFALPFYDVRTTSNLSLYHLGHLTNSPRKLYFDVSYHNVHIELLEVLYSIYPSPIYKFYVQTWSGKL